MPSARGIRPTTPAPTCRPAPEPGARSSTWSAWSCRQTGFAVGYRGPRGYPEGVSITEQVRGDMTTAMKAGEKDRVGALRLVLSELQKAQKDGFGDETAVLRRERKRRLEAAEQFRD